MATIDDIKWVSHYTHIRFLDYYHNRTETNQICKIHGIDCSSSIPKRKLIQMIILKLGDDALDPTKLYTPNDATVKLK